MTPSQEKVLKSIEKYKSYVGHKMLGENLVVECNVEHKGRVIRYLVVVGIRGGRRTVYI